MASHAELENEIVDLGDLLAALGFSIADEYEEAQVIKIKQIAALVKEKGLTPNGAIKFLESHTTIADLETEIGCELLIDILDAISWQALDYYPNDGNEIARIREIAALVQSKGITPEEVVNPTPPKKQSKKGKQATDSPEQPTSIAEQATQIKTQLDERGKTALTKRRTTNYQTGAALRRQDKQEETIGYAYALLQEVTTSGEEHQQIANYLLGLNALDVEVTPASVLGELPPPLEITQAPEQDKPLTLMGQLFGSDIEAAS